MMILRTATLALLLASCVARHEPLVPAAPSPPPEAAGVNQQLLNNCVEFTHKTRRGGQPVECRILWCHLQTKDVERYGGYGLGGGPTVLFCDVQTPEHIDEVDL